MPGPYHKDTFELVQRDYLGLKEDFPTCTPVQQIWNTIQRYGPDIEKVVQSIREGDNKIREEIERYPQDAHKLQPFLEWSKDFYRLVDAKNEYLNDKTRETLGQRIVKYREEQYRKSQEELREKTIKTINEIIVDCKKKYGQDMIVFDSTIRTILKTQYHIDYTIDHIRKIRGE